MPHTRSVAPLLHLCTVLVCCLAATGQQSSRIVAAIDSDGDGLPDAVEAALLARFSPAFHIAQGDCSGQPAQFLPQPNRPAVMSDDGTIYGQATPRKGHPGEVELHYFHLWRRDCGELGHALDTEHVSALVSLEGDRTGSSEAFFWYAAAHEDTMCDASHLVRASAIHASDRGAEVWISSGKHASFLSETLCTHGCGGDRCTRMRPLTTRAVINLGEGDAPMNGIAWLNAAEWPLRQKMLRSDFTGARLHRVDRAPEQTMVWADPSKRPARAAILGLNAGLGGGVTGAQATDTALTKSGKSTHEALATSARHTARALQQSSRKVLDALHKSAAKTGDLLQGSSRSANRR